MRKTLIYSSFVFTSLIVVAAFVTARNYTQLAAAIIMYPLLGYLIFKLFPRKTLETPVIAIPQPVKSLEKVDTEVANPAKEDVSIADIDKRAFLKLIGAAGLSLFLYSILFKRAQGTFFGGGQGSGTVSLKDSAERKIDPAERQPTDGYRITEIDDSPITYYGFTNRDEAWFIMREDTETGSFRYTKGTQNFTSGWTNREHLTYDYYTNIF